MPRAEHPDTEDFGERIQIGVKMEKKLVKVLKALAEYHDITLGEMLESLVLHAFAQKLPFDDAVVARVEQLKRVYGMEFGLEVARTFAASQTTQPKLL